MTCGLSLMTDSRSAMRRATSVCSQGTPSACCHRPINRASATDWTGRRAPEESEFGEPGKSIRASILTLHAPAPGIDPC
jgi:hypothetical protein